MGLCNRKNCELLALEEGRGEPLQLKETLGPLNLILLGIGCIVGAGLFSVTGIVAASYAGPAILLSFVIAALGCCFAALCYSELVAMYPLSGSAYTYAYVSMGRMIAWIIGWDLLLEYAIGAATVAISWSAYFVSLLHSLNIHLPHQIAASPWQAVQLLDGSSAHGWINLPAIFALSFATLILIAGIRESALLNAILVTLKVAVILLFIAVGSFYIHLDYLHPFIPENRGSFGEFGWSGILKGAAIIFFAYIGFDAVSTAAQEAKNPARSVPIGILGSLFICTLLYIMFAFVMTGLVRYPDLNVAAPVALAIDQTPFYWLQGLIKLAIIMGFTSVILVLLLGQSRIFYAMARDRLLPTLFAELHGRFHTPWKANLILFLYTAIFAAFVPIEVISKLTSIGTLLAFIIVCSGVMILRYRQPEKKRPFRVPWSPLIPLLGIFTCLTMMLSLGVDTWLRLFIWMAVGALFYFFWGRNRASLHFDG